MLAQFVPEDWTRMFVIDTPLFELAARGTVLYFAILVLMRLMPWRMGGELATMHLISLLLIAAAASNAFGDYKSVTDGLLLVAVLMMWNFLVNAASYRFRIVERLVSAPPIQIIRDGKLLKRNMRREFLTEEELMTVLREQNIASLDQVESAYVEGEGAITVVARRG